MNTCNCAGHILSGHNCHQLYDSDSTNGDCGHENSYLISQHMIQRMLYTGVSTVFIKKIILKQLGCVSRTHYRIRKILIWFENNIAKCWPEIACGIWLLFSLIITPDIDTNYRIHVTQWTFYQHDFSQVPAWNMGWKYLSIPELQPLSRWSFWMDK